LAYSLFWRAHSRVSRVSTPPGVAPYLFPFFLFSFILSCGPWLLFFYFAFPFPWSCSLPLADFPISTVLCLSSPSRGGSLHHPHPVPSDIKKSVLKVNLYTSQCFLNRLDVEESLPPPSTGPAEHSVFSSSSPVIYTIRAFFHFVM